MPRPGNAKKLDIRICAACGYELGPQSAGTCPACQRLGPRLTASIPRPSELRASREAKAGPTGSASPLECAPSPGEYRAILAERRAQSPIEQRAPRGVIRTASLRRSRTPAPAERVATADELAVSAPSVGLRAPGKRSDAASSGSARGRGSRKRRSVRGSAQSRSSAEDTVRAVPAPLVGGKPIDHTVAVTETSELPSATGPQTADAASADPNPKPWLGRDAFPLATPLPGQPSGSRVVTHWRAVAFAILVVTASVLSGVAVFLLAS